MAGKDPKPDEPVSYTHLVGKMIENLDILEEFLKAFPIKEESIEVEDHIAKYERPEGYPQKLIALEEVVEKACLLYTSNQPFRSPQRLYQIT